MPEGGTWAGPGSLAEIEHLLAQRQQRAQTTPHTDRRHRRLIEGDTVIEVKGLTIDPAILEWRKSTRSGPNTDMCVEVATVGNGAGVALRDSKAPHGLMLVFTRDEWGAFLAGANDGEFDL